MSQNQELPQQQQPQQPPPPESNQTTRSPRSSLPLVTLEPDPQAPGLQSLKGLRNLLRLKQTKLLTFPTLNKKIYYQSFKIQKGSAPSGKAKFRIIHVPSGILKFVQGRLYSRFLKHIETPDYLWAFEANRSIGQMVRTHCDKELVISYDLKNYFTSITNHHIIAALSHYNIFGRAAEVISELVTYKFFLPQGTVTSPKISNMVTSATFGPVIYDFCQKVGVDITIYADDITLSIKSVDETFAAIRAEYPEIDQISIPQSVDPQKIAKAKVVNFIHKFVKESVTNYGFKINYRKTKVMSRHVRQYVCGVVTNVHPTIQRRDRCWLRAVIHNICCNGVEAEAAKSEIDPMTFVMKVRGKVLWLKSLNEHQGNRLLTKLDAFLNVGKYRQTKVEVEAETEAETDVSVDTRSEADYNGPPSTSTE